MGIAIKWEWRSLRGASDPGAKNKNKNVIAYLSTKFIDFFRKLVNGVCSPRYKRNTVSCFGKNPSITENIQDKDDLLTQSHIRRGCPCPLAGTQAFATVRPTFSSFGVQRCAPAITRTGRREAIRVVRRKNYVTADLLTCQIYSLTAYGC